MTTRTWNWKRAGSGLIAGAAAAVLIGSSAAPALAAAPTWTVRPGGVATAKAVGKTFLKDIKTGTVLACNSSKATVKLKHGSHLAGASIGLITAISFTGCHGPDGLVFSVHSAHLPWHLNAVSYNKAKGLTTGTITGIHSTLSGSGCTAVVDGTGAAKNNGMVAVTYSNKTHRLTVLAAGGNLRLYHVSVGCFGLVNSGDRSTYAAVNAVSPAQTITHP